MAFDPLPSTTEAREFSHDDVIAIASAAAERLIQDLKQAEAISDSWHNEEIGQLLVDHALSKCLNRLASTGLWGEANQLPSSVFWKTAGPLLKVGWLQNRARTKPLGYAGDHEILARMFERTCCDHPLGRLFDRYFLSLAAPRAVRWRMRHVASTFVAHRLERPDDAYHVVSLGSGPGLDVQLALSVLPPGHRSGIRVTLLDLDPAALECAADRLYPFISEDALVCRRENLYRLASSASIAADLDGTSLLVCTGFFDYLRDDVAAEMLRFFWRCLAPGGRMLVGNFAPHNPTRAYMEWIGNWYLTYRTADQLRSLAAQAEIPTDRYSIQTERTGVDLFLVGEK